MSHKLSTLVVVHSFFILAVSCTELNNLLTIHMDFTDAFFPVSRAVVEEALRERIGRDDECGPDINLTIPDGSIKYKGIAGPDQYVISPIVVKYTAPQLDEELCNLNDVSDEYATSHYAVIFRIPELINNRGPPYELGLQLAYYTNSRKKVIYPFFHNNVQYVDDITVDEDRVILSHGDDVMIMNIQHDYDCRLQDQATENPRNDSRVHSFTSFPAEIDWHFCEYENWNPKLCQHLLDDRCEITRYHGDYCVNFVEVFKGKDCDVNMTITEASGIFKKMAFMEAMISLPPSRGVSSEGPRTLGIQYPCITSFSIG